MNLRRQLLLVSLLLLALPWAGCQFVTEMEAALQHGQEQSLQSTTRAVATVLGGKPALLYPTLQRWQDSENVSKQLYAIASSAPIIVDGYDDGWNGPLHGSFGPVSYRAQTRDGRLYLLVSVTDKRVTYQDPRHNDTANGDRLVLRTASGRDYVIATAGPGPVQARYGHAGKLHSWESRIRGQWQDTLQGFSIELELPLELTGNRLGFYVLDVDAGSENASGNESFGNITAAPNQQSPWLIYPPDSLQTLITPFAGSDLRLLVVDRHHWVVARAGHTGEEEDSWRDGGASTPWLLKAIYRAILNGSPLRNFPAPPMFGQQVGLEISRAMAGQSATGWYAQDEASPHKLLTAASPILSEGEVVGVVMAQQNSEQYLSLTDRAFNRLLLYSLAAMGISALGLLGYASWLSWRIRRLSAATRQVIAADGSIRADFPRSRSNDELGDLSRRYAELLGRLREYTEYLRTLSRKLSHELRTPIAVIQSSLDNLEHDSATPAVYLERAREGLQRLNHILTAMSEASRLEESVHNNTMEDFDLVQLCRQMFTAYQEVYREHQLEFECALPSQHISGAPDLVVQLLDKLFDNACSFAPAGGRVRLSVQEIAGAGAGTGGVKLALSNQGPLLPGTMQNQLFESMVSVREQDQQGHMGLGLHIVRLIAEFHGGRVYAENLADGSGVIFVVEFPLR